MTTFRTILTGGFVLALAAPTTLRATEAQTGGARQFRTAQVHFQNAQRQPVGEAVLRETANGVLITAKLRGLPPGEHGFHVHQRGVCQAPFDSAGEHFNPTGKSHGFEDAAGPHAGDLPNIIVPASGNVEFEMLAPHLSLEEGTRTSVIDADGAAIVIHSGPDDYSTDPAGDAGDRIACGIIERSRMAAEGEVVPRTAERATQAGDAPAGGTEAGVAPAKDVPRGAMQVPAPTGAQ